MLLSCEKCQKRRRFKMARLAWHAMNEAPIGADRLCGLICFNDVTNKRIFGKKQEIMTSQTPDFPAFESQWKGSGWTKFSFQNFFDKFSTNNSWFIDSIIFTPKCPYMVATWGEYIDVTSDLTRLLKLLNFFITW